MNIVGFFLHLDTQLQSIIESYGVLTYVIVFLIIFAETGLVIAPFLPGDSLLFATGAFAAQGSLNSILLFVLLSAAAIVGDSVNYAVGSYIGPRVFKEDRRWLRRDHLLEAEAFYQRHGGKAIIFARFMPIIRTLAPFVAGIGSMDYRRFLFFNITGGVIWVGLFVFGGYFFGAIPIIKENFEIAIIAIVAMSFVPPIIHYIKGKLGKKKPNM